jgi:hypothetical protein
MADTLADRRAAAIQASRRAVRAVADAFGLGCDEADAAIEALAHVLIGAGQFRRAEAVAKALLRSRTERLGAQHPRTWGGFTLLAEIYRRQERLEEAAAALDASDNDKRAFASAHPDVLRGVIDDFGLAGDEDTRHAGGE